MTKSILQEVNLNVRISNGWVQKISGQRCGISGFLAASHAAMNLLTKAHTFGYQIRANKE